MTPYHVYPNRDLIDHDTESEDCICGPRIEHVNTRGRDGWIITHHSLDGREKHETPQH